MQFVFQRWSGAVEMRGPITKGCISSMRVFFCLAMMAVLPCGVAASEPAEPKVERGQTGLLETLKQEAVKKVGPQAYEIGNVHIDAAAREIRFPATVNMNEGLIEVVISTPEGKLHESILVASIQPLHLHTALLLLGLNPGSNPGWRLLPDPSMRPKGWDRPPGSQVNVFVGWDTPEGMREVRAESLLMDTRTGDVMPETVWVFVGSRLSSRGKYLADGHGSIMTNYHDSTAVLDNPLDSGRIDDFMHANSSRVPSLGTSVRIRMTPAGNNGKGVKNE